MDKHFKKILMILTVFLFVAGLAVVESHAQNFSGYSSDDEDYEELTDAFIEENIEQILIDEGIPINPKNSNADYSSSKYTLGIDDIIEITVQRHPEVSGEYAINKEGKIQYGFVGDIEIAGLTKDEASEVIKQQLSKFIINPDLIMIIKGYNSKVVYVIGEVGRPGKIFMRGDTITIREALIDAALPLLTAKTKAGRLITPSESGKAKMVKVNVHKLLYEGDLRENLVMKPGDTLYVPATGLTKTMRAIQPVAQPVGAGVGLGRNVATPLP